MGSVGQSLPAYMAAGDFSLQEEFYLFASAVSVLIIEHLVRRYRSRDTGRETGRL